MAELNPANVRLPKVTDDTRVPMGTKTLMLEVPPIEGYVLYWFADRPGRIGRALAAGYEFVTPEEVQLNNFSLAGDYADSGNTDLGTRISVHGGAKEGGGSERLYLMKIKKEWHKKDMELREQDSDRVIATLKGGQLGADGTPVQGSPQDIAHRYTRHTENIFTKKKLKGAD